MDATEIKKKIDSIDTDNETKALLKDNAFLYEQAAKAFKENRHNDIIEILEVLIKRVPNDISAKAMLAAVYGYMGYPIKSIRLWEEVCEIEPYNGEYSLELALAYHSHEWTQKAIKQLKTTVELIPDNIVAWELLVDCYDEIGETHETMVNCFSALYLLNEYGTESIKLNVRAFSIMVLDDKDKAEKYLTTIIDIMCNGEKRTQEYYEYAIHDILWDIDIAECYEFMPHIKKMEDILSDISEELAEHIFSVEINAEIAIIEDEFPEALTRLLNLLNSDCDCEECKRTTTSLECSILVDYDGYKPELIRLFKEHPKLYALHSEFFNEAGSSIERDRLLMTRLRTLSEDNIEPILIRADGSEINPVVETYRREGPKIGRNELCPCGSGKKYKKCCGS